jgi:Putative zinc-finger
MMESCARLVGMLQGYAEGQAPPDDSRRVSLHLDSCASCRRRVARYRVLFRALDRMPRVLPPTGWLPSLMARILEAPPPAVPSRPRGQLRLIRSLLWAVGAAGLLSGGAGVAAIHRSYSSPWPLANLGSYLGWTAELVRIAFSFLVQVRSVLELPSLFPTLHNPFGWGVMGTALPLLAVLAGLFGIVALATARVLLNQNGR